MAGTIQQVAEAVGTATCTTDMTVTAAGLAADGMGEIAVQAAGINTAFTIGAVAAVLAFGATLFARQDHAGPKDAPVH